MRPLMFALVAPLSLLMGCPGPACDCSGAYSGVEAPNGEFEIYDADDESLVGGIATFTEDTVTFSYTDPDGNEWEVEYLITE